MLKIDAHTHVGEGSAKWTGKDVVDRMDTIGVNKTVIFPFTEGTYNNKHVMPYVKQYPDRLIPFCSVVPWDRKDAQDELERCFNEGFKGVKLHPTINGFRLSEHSLCDPIFEIVQAHDGVIIAHGASDLYNCPLEFDRMARRFPKVPLIIAHCGFFWEWELACEVACENENLYLETSRVPPYELSTILKKASAKKMMWGTDGPFTDYAEDYRKIEHIARNDQEFEQLIGGTIAGLLGIE
jgi:predicted TIM-barrel fold metal-dependent hydrolase